MADADTLRIGHYLRSSVCEGPGTRFAVWVAGCSLGCPGCCNPELFDPRAGREVAFEELAAQMVAAGSKIEGLSILGGEPFEQADAVLELCSRVRRELPRLGIVIFTGFEVDELRERVDFAHLCGLVDTLVTGRFDARRLEPAVGGRRYLGSTNQILFHASSRYADEALWRGPVSAEVQIDARGRLTVHGEPQLTRLLRRRLEGEGSAGSIV